eukprot:TRINITY_DN76874_c0_g1_i1.p1 TRINITY_DN76874_c0_g1~~TRINITY_DN76874_c0_g1_i1.p1  ORF type:complete len:117 (-),score=23.94 TRINITY_DN76874_c0_g1_i1:61-375(-)
MGAAVTSACSNCKEQMNLEMSYVPKEGEVDQEQEFMVEAIDHERRPRCVDDDDDNVGSPGESRHAVITSLTTSPRPVLPMPVISPSAAEWDNAPGLRSDVKLGT